MEKNLKPILVNNKMDPEGFRVQTVVVHKKFPEGKERPVYTLELGSELPEDWRRYLYDGTMGDYCIRRMEPATVVLQHNGPHQILHLEVYWLINRGIPPTPRLVEQMINEWVIEVYHLGTRREGSPKILTFYRDDGFFRFYRYNRCSPLDEPEFSPIVQITVEEYQRIKDTLDPTSGRP